MRKSVVEVVISLTDKITKEMKKVSSGISASLKKATLASVAFAGAFVLGMKSVVTAAGEMESSMIGLKTVAKAFGQGADEATKAAQDLAVDGLMSVKDSAAGLKNLLATGFALPEAIKLMNGFKDSAAFNRQGTLEFGAAIVGATQGLKNQNSIMVDNAGVTKNLSNILVEAGLSAADLSKVTSDANVRQALYNGLLKETAIFSGDASKAAETYQGQMAKLKTAVFNLKVAIGEELLPIVTKLIENGLTPMIEKIESAVGWFKEHKGATTILAGAILGALVPAVWAAVTAFAAWGLTLIPFILVGGYIAAIVGFLDFLLKETTGFGLLEQVTAAFQLLGDTIGGVIEKVKNLFNKISKGIQESKFGKSANKIAEQALRDVGFLAQGGPAQAGKPYIVGEQGPELFVPRNTGDVVSNEDITTGGGGSSNVVLNVHVGLFAGSAVELRNISEMMYRKLVEVARSRDTSVATLLGA